MGPDAAGRAAQFFEERFQKRAAHAPEVRPRRARTVQRSGYASFSRTSASRRRRARPGVWSSRVRCGSTSTQWTSAINSGSVSIGWSQSGGGVWLRSRIGDVVLGRVDGPRQA